MITVEHLEGPRFRVSDGERLVYLVVDEAGHVFIWPPFAFALVYWPTLFEVIGSAWRLTPVGRAMFEGARGETGPSARTPRPSRR